MSKRLLLPPIETDYRGARRGFNVSWQDFGLLWLGALLLLLLIVLAEWFPAPILSVLSPLRLLLALLYILFVPGYCLMTALFPRQHDLDHIERTGLSLGLSIVIVPFLALLLDFLPWGIRLWPIVVGEYGVMALCTMLGLWRRTRLPVEAAYRPQFSWAPRPWWHSLLRVEKLIYKLLAVALLLAGLSAAWIFLVPSPNELMTEFYILGEEGLAEDYPREVMVGEELSVKMGIINREQDEHRYRVEVWAVDPWQVEGRQLVSEAGSFTLLAGDEWAEEIRWSMPWAGNDQNVEFLLFIDDRPEPYRTLRLWLNVVK